MALLNAILFGLSGLTVIPLASDFFKAVNPDQSIYSVTIGIGQGTEESHSLGGNEPGVSLWTARGEAIGGVLGSGRVLADATPHEVKIEGNNTLGGGKAPAEYISVTASGIDGICVSYISVVEPSQVKAVFLLETAVKCGATWYPSTLTIGGKRPSCVWLDKDGSAGNRFRGIGVHLPDFSSAESAMGGLSAQYGNDSDTMCGSGPRLRLYENLNPEDPILFFSPPFTKADFNDDGSDKDRSKIVGNPGKFTDINMKLANKACSSDSGCPNIIEQIRETQNPRPFPVTGHRRTLKHRGFLNQTSNPWSDQVVISHYEQHNATIVCSSATSRGPDFVSMVEMKFCDMSNKMLWDVCANTGSKCCFDVEQTKMRPCDFKLQGGAQNRVSIPQKTYRTVKQWKE